MRFMRQEIENRLRAVYIRCHYGFDVPGDQMTSKQYWLSVGPGLVGPRKPETEQHCFNRTRLVGGENEFEKDKLAMFVFWGFMRDENLGGLIIL